MKFPKIVRENNNRIIAFPTNTKEVSNIVKFSKKNGLNIIPLGGEKQIELMAQNMIKNLKIYSLASLK